MTAVIVILGAELNRGIYEFKRMSAMGLDPAVAPSPTRAR
jgi:membrane protein